MPLTTVVFSTFSLAVRVLLASLPRVRFLSSRPYLLTFSGLPRGEAKILFLLFSILIHVVVPISHPHLLDQRSKLLGILSNSMSIPGV